QWYQLWHSAYQESVSLESEHRESRAKLQSRVTQAESDLLIANKNYQTLAGERDALLAERTERMAVERAGATEAEAEVQRLREELLLGEFHSLLAKEGAAADAEEIRALKTRCDAAEWRLQLSEESNAQLVKERDALLAEQRQLHQKLKAQQDA